MTNYKKLKYFPDTVHSAQRAESAIKIIEEITDQTPHPLPYLLEPSNLLALADMRALGPYNNFVGNLSKDDFRKMELILNRHGFYIFRECPNMDSLVNLSAIQSLPKKYGFLANSFPDLKDYSQYNFLEWTFMLERALGSMISDKKLPVQWDKYWTPHDLSFGMLLGYPGVAITSLIQDNTAKGSSSTADDYTASIVISEASDAYAEVSFACHRSVADSEEVTELVQSWKKTIDTVSNYFKDAK